MAIRFRVEGDLRFISHHDMMRLFERALARARLPVKYSEGFNPRPRMSLPLPRPVGMATLADVLMIELHEPVEPADALACLSRQMPEGLTLLEAFPLKAGDKLHPAQVIHEVALPEDEAWVARAAVERLLAAEQWLIERTDAQGRPQRTLDLRSLLIDASVESGVLRWTHRVSNDGSARPAEWLRAFGLEPTTWLHRIRRTAVHWQPQISTGQALEAVESIGVTNRPG